MPLPLPSLIRASAYDVANQSMRSANRSRWSRKDYNLAAATQNRLIDRCYGTGPEGRIKFGVAEQLEKAGRLSITMKPKEFFAIIDAACAG